MGDQPVPTGKPPQTQPTDTPSPQTGKLDALNASANSKATDSPAGTACVP